MRSRRSTRCVVLRWRRPRSFKSPAVSIPATSKDFANLQQRRLWRLLGFFPNDAQRFEFFGSIVPHTEAPAIHFERGFYFHVRRNEFGLAVFTRQGDEACDPGGTFAGHRRYAAWNAFSIPK